MRNNVLTSIDDLNDYMAVLEAITGTKQDFTEEETGRLIAIYEDEAENKFGFTGSKLVKMLLVLDTAAEKGRPDTSSLFGILDMSDRSALGALTTLCGDWEQKPGPALAAKTASLTEGINESLALALARAALDVLAGQNDIAPYREDIAALAEFLKNAGEETFANASRFLLRVRERVR